MPDQPDEALAERIRAQGVALAMERGAEAEDLYGAMAPAPTQQEADLFEAARRLCDIRVSYATLVSQYRDSVTMIATLHEHAAVLADQLADVRKEVEAAERWISNLRRLVADCPIPDPMPVE